MHEDSYLKFVRWIESEEIDEQEEIEQEREEHRLIKEGRE